MRKRQNILLFGYSLKKKKNPLNMAEIIIEKTIRAVEILVSELYLL